MAGAVAVTRHDIDMQVTRYEATGTMDSSFSNPPFDYTAQGTTGSDEASSLNVQENGQAYVAGNHSSGGFTLGVRAGPARL